MVAFLKPGKCSDASSSTFPTDGLREHQPLALVDALPEAMPSCRGMTHPYSVQACLDLRETLSNEIGGAAMHAHRGYYEGSWRAPPVPSEFLHCRVT